MADDCVLLEKRLKEDVMWQKESGVWQWKLPTTWRGLTTCGQLEIHQNYLPQKSEQEEETHKHKEFYSKMQNQPNKWYFLR